LEDFVAAYGPPELLYLSAYCEGGEDADCSAPPYDLIDFVWPAQGVVAFSENCDGLYTQDGRVPPFSSTFAIDYVEHYSPFTLPDYENSDYHAGGYRFAWSGFAEDDED
jgi:hypothetical protein